MLFPEATRPQQAYCYNSNTLILKTDRIKDIIARFKIDDRREAFNAIDDIYKAMKDSAFIFESEAVYISSENSGRWQVQFSITCNLFIVDHIICNPHLAPMGAFEGAYLDGDTTGCKIKRLFNLGTMFLSFGSCTEFIHIAEKIENQTYTKHLLEYEKELINTFSIDCRYTTYSSNRTASLNEGLFFSTKSIQHIYNDLSYHCYGQLSFTSNLLAWSSCNFYHDPLYFSFAYNMYSSYNNTSERIEGASVQKMPEWLSCYRYEELWSDHKLKASLSIIAFNSQPSGLSHCTSS